MSRKFFSTIPKQRLAGLLCVCLAACVTSPPTPLPHQQEQSSDQARAATYGTSYALRAARQKQAFNTAMSWYEQGQYQLAVTAFAPLVGAPELPATTQLEVLKYSAFSYCLLRQLPSCRQHFELALAQNPNFELSLAERGHPAWSKVFIQAKLHIRNKRVLQPITP